MRKLIAILIIHFALIGVALSQCPNIKVTGAGYEQVNGSYKCNGVYNGKYFWNLEGYPVSGWQHSIYWSLNYGGGWAISDSPLVIYFAYGNTKLPLQVRRYNWHLAMLDVEPIPYLVREQ